MPAALHCLSHTPVFGKVPVDPAVDAGVKAALGETAAAIAAFDPELIVLFGPDHYMGFFHKLMPPFCIGTAATAVGDYGTSAGPLDVPADVAIAMAQACHDAGVDVAVSRAMRVDHGFSQALDLVGGGLARYPVVPVFVNAVGQPLGPIARSRALGAAIGGYLARAQGERRVLVMASGGLSHDPPIPLLDSAPPEVVERLIAGGDRAPYVQVAHEARVVAAAARYAAVDPVVGGGERMPLNPAWDRWVLDALNRGDLDALDALSNAEIDAAAGGSGQEIRCWIAAYACLAAFGAWQAETRYYRAIPQWIAGFAVVAGGTT